MSTPRQRFPRSRKRFDDAEQYKYQRKKMKVNRQAGTGLLTAVALSTEALNTHDRIYNEASDSQMVSGLNDLSQFTR